MDLKIKIDLSDFNTDKASPAKSSPNLKNFSDDHIHSSGTQSNDQNNYESTNSHQTKNAQGVTLEGQNLENVPSLLHKKKKNPIKLSSRVKNEFNPSSKKKPKKKLGLKESSSKKLSMVSLLSNPSRISKGSSIPGKEIKPQSSHWEERWILYPNVFEFTKEIWLKKWVLVDGGDDNYDTSQPYLPSFRRSYKEVSQRKYTCMFENCGKIFYDSTSFRKHQQTHGEKHYVCPIEGCGKKFLDNSKLKRHQLVHSGEKNYICDICGKRFSLDFNLKTHYRTHTGEKPYKCPYPGCQRKFTQSSNLTAHEKTHKEAMNKEKSSVKVESSSNIV